MILRSKFKGQKILASTLTVFLLALPIMSSDISAAKPSAVKPTPAKAQTQVELRIMETTDIHTNLLSFDYYKNSLAPNLGLAKTATLVKTARAEVKNSVLVDNGDLIQGTPLGTYKAKVDPIENGEVHPAIKALNLMKYDVATLGNHEFNYGLDFLDEVYDDAKFPLVNANVYVDDHDKNPKNDKNKYTPYKIVDKKVVDKSGKSTVIKIGYIGFVPPQISEWDKANLDGKVITKDIVETAKKFIPVMEKKGADVIIALAHSGFNGSEANTEDTVYALSKVTGIDAITFSHTHKTFPAKSVTSLDALFKDANGQVLPGVDNAKGTINGVAAVQAGYGGASLGIIDLTLQKVEEQEKAKGKNKDKGKGKSKDKDKEKDNSKWIVASSQSSTREVETVQADSTIVKAVTADHEATLKYVNTPIGTTTDDIYSYFALVQDDPSVQVVTNAQKWYVENYITLNKPELKDLPILSVGAPFKAGRNGVDEYTEIKKGGLTISSAADLYLYDNTLKAVKIKGSVVKEWIEMSAGKFNTIDPSITTNQELLNSAFAVYNFDVIDGVDYQIDVTKAPKYSTNGTLLNPDSSRVVNLEYNGQPLDLDQEFVVITNNYRASGGGNFPGLKGSELVVDSADENRQILMDYIAEEKEITPTADGNWSIAPISADVNVTFTTSPKAEQYITAGSPFSYTGNKDSKGFGIFNMDLNRGLKVQLLGVNDLHGQLDTVTTVDGLKAGNIEYTAAALKKEEATNSNTLIFHAGDMIGGSPLISALFQDEPTVEILESIGFDAGTFGNHEFDEGIDELKRMINGGDHEKGNVGYDGMDFPLVAANVYDTRDGKLITDPYTVFTIEGQKIGVIGVVTQETPSMIVRKGNESLQITDEVEAINKYTEELTAQGIEAIIVLAHNPATQTGYTDAFDASKIAEQVNDEVDVIFAAHNHVKVNRVVDNKLIVQAYSYGYAFSDVDIEIDPLTGDIFSKEAEIKTIYQKDYTPDPEVAAIMKKYSDKVEPIKAQIIGQNATTLVKSYPTTASDISDIALGNLIADGMRGAMDSDFALMNGGGVRAPLDAGEVTFGALFAIQPFGNVLNKVNLSGADLRVVLNEQITTRGLDYHVSGFKYTYTFDTDTLTGQVVDILLPDGSKIDESKEYSVVVNNYMYGNISASIGKLSTDMEVGPIDVDATVEYVKTLPSPFDYKVEGRIQRVY